jgi:hypothetical protein
LVILALDRRELYTVLGKVNRENWGIDVTVLGERSNEYRLKSSRIAIPSKARVQEAKPFPL